MKPIYILTGLLFLSVYCRAQANLDQILQQIEENNKELKANQALIQSQRLEVQTINNLADPQFNYSHVWNSKESSLTAGELTITQSFDFPTLYFSRNKVKNYQLNTYNYQAEALRQNILLQAKEICLDLIALQQQKEILKERLNQTRQLYELYQERLTKGDANLLETNKVKLELLNATTEWQLKEKEWNNKKEDLKALNGNNVIDLPYLESTRTPLPASFEEVKQVYLAEDFNLLALDEAMKANQKQISVNRSYWLPKFELGYKRTSEVNSHFNGIVVGFSIPLFENRKKTKIAKAQALNISLTKEDQHLQTETQLKQAYQEAISLYENLLAYDQQFEATTDLALLIEALNGGQISLIEFFTEATIIYQSQLNYIDLENQYEKAMALLYKNRL